VRYLPTVPEEWRCRLDKLKIWSSAGGARIRKRWRLLQWRGRRHACRCAWLIHIGDAFGFAFFVDEDFAGHRTVIMVSLPVFNAGGSRTWLELKFEAVMQPRPHWPQ